MQRNYRRSIGYSRGHSSRSGEIDLLLGTPNVDAEHADFVQTSQSSVRIRGAGYDMGVAVVAFRQEQAWTG